LNNLAAFSFLSVKVPLAHAPYCSTDGRALQNKLTKSYYHPEKVPVMIIKYICTIINHEK